jgi:predicted nuclease of predicted toxin-antitoxin system
MNIWLDNHLAPGLALWIADTFSVRCSQVRDLGLARASDITIFEAARLEADAIMTKDRDFAELAARLGPPPTVILVAVGNTSTKHMRELLQTRLGPVLDLVRARERLIEIG